jgi:RHS repeat-associated protein
MDEEFYAIVTDLVGTPTELVDTSGSVVWRPRRTLWGVTHPPPDAAVDCPLRFPGQYADDESGLEQNQHRYYDPVTARFASPDPMGLLAGLNPVGYVHNPTAAIDPSGLTPCRIPHRTPPRIEDGNLREGWTHIDALHVTGNHPSGPGDLFAPGTTRSQLDRAAQDLVKKGTRVSDPSSPLQIFEKRMVVNGVRDRVRVVVDPDDANRVITIFPVRGG